MAAAGAIKVPALGTATTYQRHQRHRETVPVSEVEAFVELLAVDPEPSALGRPRTAKYGLRAALMTIVEHFLYAVGFGLGVAGAGLIVIELIALVLNLAGVDGAFGWGLTVYLGFAATLLVIGGIGRLAFGPAPRDRAAALVADAEAETYPSSRKDLGKAKARLRGARGRRAAAVWLAALLRRLPELPALEVTWSRDGEVGCWTFDGLEGVSGPVQLRMSGAGHIEAENRATFERRRLTSHPDSLEQTDARDAILGWLGVDPGSSPAAREPVRLGATRLTFWIPLALWFVVWIGAVIGGTLAVLERLPSQWAALAGYVIAASVSVLLMGLRTHLPFRHPGLGGPILSSEERAADIYDAHARATA